MRKLKILFSILAITIVAILLWYFWPIPNPMAELQSAEEFILYSIDGRDEYQKKKHESPLPKSTETFHNYPVLGKVKIDQPEERRKLIAAFGDALYWRPSIGAKCFWPRHAIHAVVKGRTVDFVICFECSRFIRTEITTKRNVSGLLNEDAQPVFDKPLTDAGIPIAPK